MKGRDPMGSSFALNAVHSSGSSCRSIRYPLDIEFSRMAVNGICGTRLCASVQDADGSHSGQKGASKGRPEGEPRSRQEFSKTNGISLIEDVSLLNRRWSRSHSMFMFTVNPKALS
jgi:hypothetical protein